MNHGHTPETPQQPLQATPHDPVTDYLDFIDKIDEDVNRIPDQTVEERVQQLFGNPALSEEQSVLGNTQEAGVLCNQPQREPDFVRESDALEIVAAAQREATRIRYKAQAEATRIRDQAERNASAHRDDALTQAAQILTEARRNAKEEAASLYAEAERQAAQLITEARRTAGTGSAEASKQARVGSPTGEARPSKQVLKRIAALARERPSWGPERLFAELRRMGVPVSEQDVQAVIKAERNTDGGQHSEAEIRASLYGE
ncbi:hypothetical protein [Nonomuraea aridisoli]|uniref:Uncharacterized protein n=1 Tax=Nonomuraea aridisoli TaxID=2070368 RepID=A0A2W2EMP7_9ACTN|nr:hypothetical protein [Nonomuraea aridisoli]PZG14850.1 hypothetical protein C1J01_25725 [Nonomuraea aridisoli]